jgi:hypothetical protein
VIGKSVRCEQISVDKKATFAYSSFESSGGSGADQKRLTGVGKALADLIKTAGPWIKFWF